MDKKIIIGDCTLYLGDCNEIIPNIQATHIVSDPPYGINYIQGDKKTGYKSTFAKKKIIGDEEEFDPTLLKNTGYPMILWGGNHFANKLENSPSWLIWDKRLRNEDVNDFSDCEMAWTNLGGAARVFRHYWNGYLKDSERGEKRVHQTQKPIALMEWCIAKIKKPCVILDPYMGSGTTGVACVRLGYAFIGIEIDEHYFNVACERVKKAYSQIKLQLD
jgi:site-specific DNA-methyltransferase (adenine-specific)/modification methylase